MTHYLGCGQEPKIRKMPEIPPKKGKKAGEHLITPAWQQDLFTCFFEGDPIKTAIRVGWDLPRLSLCRSLCQVQGSAYNTIEPGTQFGHGSACC